MAAARGFCDMAAMAEEGGQGRRRHALRDARAEGERGLPVGVRRSADGARRIDRGPRRRNKYYDGSVAEAFDWNLLADFERRHREGDARRCSIICASTRAASSATTTGSVSYDNNEWILVDLRISNALRRAGKTRRRRRLSSAQIVEKAAANFFLLPELYNDTAADGADRQVLRLASRWSATAAARTS